VWVWDANTGTALQTLEGHTSSVTAVQFSPDGSKLASASDDGTVRVWDANTGTALQTLECYTSSVTAVQFSPDGSKLASASRDDTVRVWYADTGAALHTLEGHTHWVTAVQFSPDGSKLASASRDGTVRVWDADTGTALQTRKGSGDIAVIFPLLEDPEASNDVIVDGLHVEYEWIDCQGHRLVWLPPNMRSGQTDENGDITKPFVHGSRVVIVSYNFQLLIWYIDYSSIHKTLHG
jgi:WD40 repeat protein